MVVWLIEFFGDKALYGRVTRPLLNFSKRGLGTRLHSVQNDDKYIVQYKGFKEN